MYRKIEATAEGEYVDSFPSVNVFIPTPASLPNVLWSQQALALGNSPASHRLHFLLPVPSVNGHEVLGWTEDLFCIYSDKAPSSPRSEGKGICRPAFTIWSSLLCQPHGTWTQMDLNPNTGYPVTRTVLLIKTNYDFGIKAIQDYILMPTSPHPCILETFLKHCLRLRETRLQNILAKISFSKRKRR